MGRRDIVDSANKGYGPGDQEPGENRARAALVGRRVLRRGGLLTLALGVSALALAAAALAATGERTQKGGDRRLHLG